MNESNFYTENDFIDLCKKLLDSSQEFSTIAGAIRKHPRYEPKVFSQYFAPVLLGYKSEVRSFFYDKYGTEHPVFDEFTYDFVGFETLEVLPILLIELGKGTFPKLAFLALMENSVLINEIFPKLDTLDLQYHSLQHWPKSIQLATSLQKLNMWGNYTKSVPSDIGNLRNLKSLILAGNSLSTLPESIAQLSELNELNLSANNFEQLPNCISKLTKLKLLKVSNNLLDKIPNFIFSMKNLEFLDLAGNQLIELPENIGKSCHLKEMDLSRNKLESIPISLMNMGKLERLNLDENPISEKQLDELKKQLPKCYISF